MKWSYPLSIPRALACVASVSVRFKSKERGTRVKDRAKNGASKRAGRGWALVSFLARPKPRILFLGLSLLRNQTETLATQATRAPSCFFPLIYFSLHRPHYLNAWNRLSALSLLPLLFSVCRILEYPGGNHFNQSDQQKRSSMGSSAWALLPTWVTAPAFLTEFAIEWTRRVSRTLVKLPTLPRIMFHVECCCITNWQRNVYEGTVEPGWYRHQGDAP